MDKIDQIKELLAANEHVFLPQELFNPRLIIHAVLCHILENKCYLTAREYRIVMNVESFIILYKMIHIITISKENYECIIDEFINCEKTIRDVNYRFLTRIIREKIISFDQIDKKYIKVSSILLTECTSAIIENLVNDIPIKKEMLIESLQEIDDSIPLDKIDAAYTDLSSVSLLAKFYLSNETVAEIVMTSIRNAHSNSIEIAKESCFMAIQELLITKQINENLRDVNMRLVSEIRKLQAQINEFDVITNAKNEQFLSNQPFVSPIVQYRMSTPVND